MRIRLLPLIVAGYTTHVSAAQLEINYHNYFYDYLESCWRYRDDDDSDDDDDDDDDDDGVEVVYETTHAHS